MRDHEELAETQQHQKITKGSEDPEAIAKESREELREISVEAYNKLVTERVTTVPK